MLAFIKEKKYWFIAGLIVMAVIVFFVYKNKTQDNTPTYVTSKVIKGTIVSSVAASGTVTDTNYYTVNTQASGVVSSVFVKDAQEVYKGQRLVQIDLDDDGLQAQAKAYATYLSAQTALNDAETNKNTLASNLEQSKLTNNTAGKESKSSLATKLATAKDDLKLAKKNYAKVIAHEANPTTTSIFKLKLEAAQAALETAQQNYDSPAGAVLKAQNDLAVAQEKFNNADTAIQKAQADFSSASIAYNETKSIVTSPITGVISGLNVFEGMTLASNSSSSGSNNTTSSNSLMAISNKMNPLISVDVSESDIIKIAIDQKVTMTLDAFNDKTFTGKVVAINKTGTTSSNVTNYPVTIQFDEQNNNVLPNMSATANIILETKTDVLSVPSAAVTQSGSEYTVQVLANGKAETKTVQVGMNSDEAIEITSGLTEGEEVITSTVTKTSTTTSSSSSVFGGTTRTGGASSLGSSGGSFGGRPGN